MTSHPDELLKRASETLADAAVWFLVDDIDASYVDSDQQQLLVSSFFSACRFVAREMKGVHVRATVRSDVWSNLRSNEDLDKCEQYVVDISWTKSELKQILAKKVFAWIQRKTGTDLLFESLTVKEDTDSVIEYAFERTLNGAIIAWPLSSRLTFCLPVGLAGCRNYAVWQALKLPSIESCGLI